MNAPAPAPQPVLEELDAGAIARLSDQYTIEDIGVPGIVLMEHAGKAVADLARRLFPHARSAVVIAGPGYNGGDGWVAARHLWACGVVAPVLTLRAPDALDGDASLAAQMFLSAAEALAFKAPPLDGAFALIDLADDVAAWLIALRPDFIIDAMFGTGLKHAPGGVAARLIDAVNASGIPILAVDMPSGLDASGTAPERGAVRAQATVTFGCRKVAHVSEPGREHCGTVHVVDIGVLRPPGLQSDVHRLVDAAALLPPPRPTAHKGVHGRVAVVRGSPGMDGAAVLAARAALRGGAGLATLWSRTDAPVPASLVEAMAQTYTAAEALPAAEALVVGPGFSRAPAALAHVAELLRVALARNTPTVVDADGLGALRDAGILTDVADPGGTGSQHAARMVLTPHPGEAARMLSTPDVTLTAADVQRDRIAAARDLYARCAGAVIVLKGTCPIVVSRTAPGAPQQVIVVEGGHQSLATAGSGDVLAGLLAALLARGLSPRDAALLGVALHQEAGALLDALGDRGVLAHEIADALPRAALALKARAPRRAGEVA